MTARSRHDSNSGDIQLMFLQDVNLVDTLADGDAIVFDEDTETFVPSAGHKVTVKTLNLTGVPTSPDGLSAGDLWSDNGVLNIFID